MNMLKKSLIITIGCIIAIAISGCNLNDDDGTRFYYEAMEVQSANFPAFFERGNIYRIDVVLNLPSNCHYFEGFDFNATGDTKTERTIYPIATVLDRTDCVEYSDRTINAFFNFDVLFNETYVFKLYTGKNENGDDEFLIYEVPVGRPAPN